MESILEIKEDEIQNAMKKMKQGKAPGPDGITLELIMEGGEIILQHLRTLFTQCLKLGRVPKSWKHGQIISIHKKGDKEDIRNYRPISLLSTTYKIFTKVLCNRMKIPLDENQPREQAGFRRNYSTTDHSHTINQLVEKTTEHQIPLCLCFIDFEKAFDTIATSKMLETLEEQGIEKCYVNILRDIYTDMKSELK